MKKRKTTDANARESSKWKDKSRGSEEVGVEDSHKGSSGANWRDDKGSKKVVSTGDAEDSSRGLSNTVKSTVLDSPVIWKGFHKTN